MDKALIESDIGCNITTEEVKTTALTIGIPGIICLPFSIVGLVAEFIFLCRKKNNFLLRLFVYLSMAVVISLGMFSLHLVSYLEQRNQVFCTVIHAILFYSFTVEHFLIFSINIIVLYKVYSSIFRPCACARPGNVLNSHYKFLEVLFVLIHFGIPVITASVVIGVQSPDDLNYWTICYVYPQAGRNSSMECNSSETILPDKILQVLIPVLIDLVLSVVCITVIVVWFLWLQRRQLLRTRMATIFKEIGLLLGYLLSYCIHGTIVTSSELSNNSTTETITLALYPVTHLVIPISFFVYMCVSIYNGHKRYTSHTEMGNARINSGATRLDTAPLSSRISLPSDTADHAPNYLSASGEVSYMKLVIKN